jgi:Cu/Ag efflux pump CusA
VMEGAVERMRPKTMMVGGMISSTVLTLAVIPAIYALVKQWRLARGLER